MGETYEAAGVNIAAGEDAVQRIKQQVRSTFRSEVIGDIGGFGGLFDFSRHGYKKPLLVSSTDGVGTKAFVAAAAGRYNTIGIDLVAMCVDDLVCHGAEPLFMLDYISVHKLDSQRIEQLVAGVAEGCRQAGCALIGGEMAEHPNESKIQDEFELVGFATGVVERSKLIGHQKVRPGDVLVGLPSPGLRCNGYSLARKLYFEVAKRNLDEPAWEGCHHSVADELLLPSVIYAPAVCDALAKVQPRAIAHITGGGIIGNLARVLHNKVDVVVDRSCWEQPQVFSELQKIGDVSDQEMAQVFNLGLGMVLIVSPKNVTKAVDSLRASGHRASVVGQIEKGIGTVHIVE
ncbi:MAG: phosphoribosylformylglycinamidine cyclo-ligase [bacterium]|nr:phosphoribosylformylglycinamidine cyclo-ligase [bacterium]MCY4163772.1 phosphoribosylformylglycinamidine cyclo-ligase [bacterium]